MTLIPCGFPCVSLGVELTSQCLRHLFGIIFAGGDRSGFHVELNCLIVYYALPSAVPSAFPSTRFARINSFTRSRPGMLVADLDGIETIEVYKSGQSVLIFLCYALSNELVEKLVALTPAREVNCFVLQ